MRRAILTAVLLAGSVMLSWSQHFTRVWSGNGFNHMNFNVYSATLNGIDCQAGDEIAVFDGGVCVGVQVVTTPGAKIYIVASKDDPLTPSVVDGFIQGHTATFKMWDASEGIETSDVTINLLTGTLAFAEGNSTWLMISAVTACARPAAPTVGNITQPSCSVVTGSVRLTGLPSSGIWTLTRTPGGNTIDGSGTSYTVTGLPAGVTYTFTVTNAAGCVSLSSSNVAINGQPATPNPPSLGNITQPTCAVATGSVVITSLPASGSWTLTRMPGGITVTGSGTSATVDGLTAGTYTFTVTNASGCTSSSSANVVIQSQQIPGAPAVGDITQPTCAVATGSVILNNLPTSGSWTLTRNPGGFTSGGSGSSVTVQNLVAGTYTFTVTNASGCTSGSSGNVVINSQPITSAPVPGTISQPTCMVNTGSVVLHSLPSSGSWTLTRMPGGNTTNGNGSSYTVNGLPSGTHTFTVTNASGCVSSASSPVVINDIPDRPPTPLIGSITQPSCTLNAGIVSLGGLPGTGSWTLTRTPGNVNYAGSGASYIVTGLPASATYTFTVTNTGGCQSVSSAPATINSQPVVPGAPVVGTIIQPTCTELMGSVLLSGLPSGNWTLAKYPGGATTPGTGTTIVVTDLVAGNFTFNVTINGGCSSALSSGVSIHDPPPAPAPPALSTITQPTCIIATGSIRLTSLPTGSWTLHRFPGGYSTSGSGSTTTISGLNPGSHNFTVSDPSGCTSASSAVVFIDDQPATPTPPVAASVSQPTCGLSTGSIFFTGLPSSDSWTLVASPGGVIGTGKGSSATVSNLAPAIYTFYVTNASGCTSGLSTGVEIFPQPSTPDAPLIGTITYPTVSTSGSVVLKGLPEQGGWILTRNPGGILTAGSGDTLVVSNLTAGTYHFSVTNDPGCTSAETTLELTNVTGLPDARNESVRLYPNPVKDNLTIMMDIQGGAARIEIITLQGTTLSSCESKFRDGKLDINTGELPSGMYLIRIMTNDRTALLRFLKR